MGKSKTVLVGNFLSQHRGTKGISEKVGEWLLEEDGLILPKASSKAHPLARAIDIVFMLLRERPNKVIVDTYSDFAFFITSLVVWVKPWLGYRVVSVVRGGKFDAFYAANEKRVRKTCKGIDEFLSPSYFLTQFLNEKGYPCTYFPNPLKLDNFPYNAAYPANQRLLWVRGFKFIYQPHLAVEILKQVLETHPEATLTMVGPDGGLLQDTQEYIAQLGLSDKITLVGPVPNDTLYQYMHTHSVLINTTQYESFGMAVMEAAAAGIPLVSTSVGELPLLWEDGEEILLAKQNSADEMAMHVNCILSDQNLAMLLRANARKKAENYNWKIVKQNWLEVLK